MLETVLDLDHREVVSRLPKKDLVLVQIRVAREQRKRLEHHARRLGMDMVDIVRDGMIARLDLLDEKEAAATAAKRERERAGAFVPTVVAHKWGRPRGLGTRKNPPGSATAAVRVPDKLKRSFRRYAEQLEAAANRDDAKKRAEAIVADIRERASTPAEAQAVHEALNAFMKDRAEARRRPEDVFEIGGDVVVFGDDDD